MKIFAKKKFLEMLQIYNGGVIMKLKKTFNYKEYASFVFFIIVFLFFSIFAKGFFTFDNIINVLRQVSIIGIVSVGMMMVILTGGIDLSVGSVIGTSATLAAYLMVNVGMNMYIAAIIAVGVGALIGLINGLLITKIDIPPLITTLAVMTGCRGLAYIITKGIPIYGFPEGFSFLGQGYIWVIPVPVLIMVAVMIVGYIVLNKTSFGMHIYGIGGNEEATRLCGVNVKKTLNSVYVISGLLAGFAGVVLLSRINTGTATVGTSYEMDVITAVVLGGVSIAGGEGKLKGVIIGVLIMGILSNGLIILGVEEYYQWVIRCIVLLLAVGFDRNAYRIGKKKRKAMLS